MILLIMFEIVVDDIAVAVDIVVAWCSYDIIVAWCSFLLGVRVNLLLLDNV